MTDTIRPEQVLAASGVFAPKFGHILKTLEESCRAIDSDQALHVLRRSPASHHRIPDRILEIIAEHLNRNGTADLDGSRNPRQRPGPGPGTAHTAPVRTGLGASLGFSSSSTIGDADAWVSRRRGTALPPLTDLEKAESSSGLSDMEDEIMSMSQLKPVDDDTVSIVSLTEEKSLLQKELHKAGQLLSKMTRERQDLGSKYIAVSEQIEQSVLAQDREKAMSDQLGSLKMQLQTVSNELQKRDDTYRRQVEAYRSTQARHANLVNTLKEKCLSYKSRSSQLYGLLKEQMADQEHLRKRLDTSESQLHAFSEQSTELTITLKALQDQEMRNRQLEDRCNRLEREVAVASQQHGNVSASHAAVLDENRQLHEKVQHLHTCEKENDQLKSCVGKLAAAVQTMKQDVHHMKGSICRDLAQTGDMMVTQLTSLKSTTTTSQRLSAIHRNALEERRDLLTKENKMLETKTNEQVLLNSELSSQLRNAQQDNMRLSSELHETHNAVLRLRKYFTNSSQHGAADLTGSARSSPCGDGSVFHSTIDVLAELNVEMQASAAVHEALRESKQTCLTKDNKIRELTSEVASLATQQRLNAERHSEESSQLNSDLRSIRERTATLVDSHQQQDEEAVAVRHEMNRMKESLLAGQKELEASVHRMADLREQLTAAEAGRRDLSAANEQLASDLDVSRSDASALKSVLEQKQDQQQQVVDEYNGVVRGHQRQLASLEADVCHLSEENSELKADLASRIASTDGLAQLADTRQEEVALLQRTVARLHTQQDQLNAEVRRLQLDADNHGDLEQRCDDREREISELKSREEQNQGCLIAAHQLSTDNRVLKERIGSLEQQLQTSRSSAIASASLSSRPGLAKQDSSNSLVSLPDHAGSASREQHSMGIISNLEDRLQQLSDRNELLQAESSAAQDELMARINQLVASNDEVKKLRLQLKELEYQVEDGGRQQEQNVKHERQQYQLLDQEARSLRGANVHLANEVAKAASEFDAALTKREAEVNLLNSSLADVTDQLEQAEDRLQTMASSRDHLANANEHLLAILRKIEVGMKSIMPESFVKLQLPGHRDSVGLPVDVAVARLVSHADGHATAVNRLSAELALAEGVQEDIKQEVERYRAEKQRLAAELPHLKSELQKKEVAVKDLTAFYDRQQATSSQLSQEVVSLRSELAAARNRLGSLEAVKESLEKALSTSEGQLQQVNTNRMELQVQVSTLSGEVQQHQLEASQLQKEQQKGDQEHTMVVQSLQLERQNSYDDASKQLQVKAEEVRRLHRAHQELKVAKEKSEVQQQEAERRLDEARSDLRERSEMHEQELQAFIAQRQEGNAKYVDNTKHVADLTSQLFELRSKLDTSEKERDRLETSYRNLKSLRSELKSEHLDAKSKLDVIASQLNSRVEQCNDLERQLQANEGEKEDMLLAIDELMSRERNLIARLKVADSKHRTLDLLRDEVADYVQERDGGRSVDDLSSYVSRSHTLQRRHDPVDRKRRDGKRRKQPVPTLAHVRSSSDIANTSLSDNRDTRSSSCRDTDDQETVYQSQAHSRQTSSSESTACHTSTFCGTSVEQKLAHTELKAAELQARVFQLEDDNHTLSAKVVQQRQRVRQTADGLIRNTSETKQIRAALRASLRQVASVDMDSRGSQGTSDLLANESDELSKTASVLSFPLASTLRLSSSRAEPQSLSPSTATPRMSRFLPPSTSTPRTPVNPLLRDSGNRRQSP